MSDKVISPGTTQLLIYFSSQIVLSFEGGGVEVNGVCLCYTAIEVRLYYVVSLSNLYVLYS